VTPEGYEGVYNISGWSENLTFDTHFPSCEFEK